jgi:hypothetical protein
MMRVTETTLAAENQQGLHIVSMCVCSLSYPERNAHAPYCYLWPVWFCNIFFTISHKWQDFRKKSY